MNVIPIGDDFYLSLAGVRDSAPGGAYLNSGTAPYTLYTLAGAAVPGGAGSLAYVAASSGNYLGTVESTVTATLTPGARYYAKIVFAQTPFHYEYRLDYVALAPGLAVIDRPTWEEFTGNTLAGADAAAAERWCGAVREAILKRLRPYLPEPQTATFIVDAPPTNVLVLPVRPVRTVTSLYLHPGADGDDTRFVAADLLTAGAGYYAPADPLDGVNRSGLLYRRGAALWGWEYRYPLGALAPAVDPNRGAVKVVAEVGEPTVPEDVRGAAVCAVTLLMNRRTTGLALQSESWGGYSYSAAAPHAAEAALNAPEVRELLRTYLTPRFA